MGLKCSDISEFGNYYSETLKVINSLNHDNPSLVQNDTFLCVVFHMNIHVEELKKETTSLLGVFSKTALESLDEMDKVRSSWKLSGNIKGNLPGKTAKIIQMVGCKSESAPVKKGKSEESVSSFPVNHHGVVPRSLYEVLKSWYQTALDFRNNKEGQNLMKSLKKQIAQAIAYDRPSRKSSWKQSKEYNAMNKKMQSATSICCAELKLGWLVRAVVLVLALALALPPVPLLALAVLPDVALITLLPPSRERSPHVRGREQSRARTDQFALDLNSIHEYRNVSNARHGCGK